MELLQKSVRTQHRACLSFVCVIVQMYLSNGNTGQCQCCYPAWDSSTPDYTFLVPYLNALSMPDLWSRNVSLFLNCIQQIGQAAVSYESLLFQKSAPASNVAFYDAQADIWSHA